MLEALDDLQDDEIYFCSGSSMNYAVLGELMTTRIKYLGAAGAVEAIITAEKCRTVNRLHYLNGD